MSNQDWLDVADAVAALREQLAEAQQKAAQDSIRLSITEITVEFGLELVRSAKADGGLKFGVVSVGAAGERTRKGTHKVTLKLDAKTPAGGSVDINDEEP